MLSKEDKKLFEQINALFGHYLDAVDLDTTSERETYSNFLDIIENETGYDKVQPNSSEHSRVILRDGEKEIVLEETDGKGEIYTTNISDMVGTIRDFKRAREMFSMRFWNNDEFRERFRKVNKEIRKMD